MIVPSGSVTNAATVTLATRLRARMRASGCAAGMSARALLARVLDCRARATGPRLAVAEEHVAGLDVLEALERGQRLVGRRVEGARHDLRPLAPRQRVARAQRVAGEQDAVALEMQDGVAGAVAGRGDRPRTTGHVEHGAVGEGRDILHAPGAPAAVGGEVGDQPPRGRAPEVREEAAVG